jgi:two-component system, NarL family, sensor kinase
LNRVFAGIIFLALFNTTAVAGNVAGFLRSLHQYDSLMNIGYKRAGQTLQIINRQLSEHPIPASWKVQAWVRNARWYQEMGACDSALFCATQAWNTAQHDSDLIPAAMAKGGAYRCNRNADSALYYYILAEKLATRFRDTAALIRCNFYLGHVHSELGKFKRAAYFYRTSNYLSKATNDKEFIARNALAGASNLADQGMLKEALPAMRQALYHCEQHNMTRLVATACNNLGLIHKELAQYEQADKYFKQSLAIQTRLNNQLEMFIEYNNIAMTAMFRQRYKEAITLLQHAVELADKSGGHPMLPEVYHNLALCYVETGDYQKAYAYKDAQKNLTDSLRSLELLKHTEQLQEEYEAEKRQLEIINLKQENEVKDLKNKVHLKQRDIMIGLAVGLLCTAILVFFILRQRVRSEKAINKKNKQIHRQQMDEVLQRSELQSIHTMLETQEKERQRIAEDLHDRIGSMLSTVKLQFSRFKPVEDRENNYGKVAGLLDDACEEIRMVSHNLVSGVLSTFGLVPALSDLAKALEESSHLTINLTTHGFDKRMPGNVEINLYRIFQELLNNTLRHAQATQVDIDLTMYNKQLTCIYSDNGKGFDTAADRHGIGIRNMYSRIDKLGGSMHIDSGKSNGSTFVLTIPGI